MSAWQWAWTRLPQAAVGDEIVPATTPATLRVLLTICMYLYGSDVGNENEALNVPTARHGHCRMASRKPSPLPTWTHCAP